MENDLKQRLHDLGYGTGSRTPQDAIDRIEALEKKNKDLLVLAIEEHARAEGLNYALSQCQPEIGTAYEKVAEAAETGLRRDLAKVFHEAFTHKYGNQPFNNDELK